jgi:hypothetical protein
MKIVPDTQNWNEGEFDWSYIPDAEPAVVTWEQANKFRLPEDYRRFILKFNGGSVYPRIFSFTVSGEGGVSSEQEELLDRIYSWDLVLANACTYKAALPTGYLVVAETPGVIEILLSVSQEQFGAIFAWSRTSHVWGGDTNNAIWRVANSFSDFLACLYDSAEASDYDAWYLPVYSRLVRELIF